MHPSLKAKIDSQKLWIKFLFCLLWQLLADLYTLQNHKVYESCIFLINFLLFENNLPVGSCIKNNHNYEKKSSSL